MKVLMVVLNAGGPTEHFIWNEVSYLRLRLPELKVLTDPVVGRPPAAAGDTLVEFGRVPRGKIAILRRLPRTLVDAVRFAAFRRFLLRNVLRPKQTLITLFRTLPKRQFFQQEFDLVHVQFASQLYPVPE